MSRCIVLALAAIVLFAPRAVAQESGKPDAPGLDPESIEKTIQGVDEELKTARDSLAKARDKQQQLKQAYAGGDNAPERPSKYEALALMRRLEERASTQQRRQALDAVQRSLDRCTVEIDRVEESQAALGDSNEDARRRWELQGYIRDLKTLQKRLTELALVREGEQETVVDTLFLLRRENLLLRGRSELSWSAIGNGMRDLAKLPGWAVHSVQAVSAYLTADTSRDALLRFGAFAGLGVVIVLLLYRAFGARARRLGDVEEPGVRTRALATVYLLLRDASLAALLFLVPYVASVTLPGLSAGVTELLQSLGQILGGLWLLRAVLREILSPEARERMPLGLNPAAAASLWRTVRLLLLVSLIMLPLLQALELLGYPNLGAREALSLLYKTVIGVLVLVLVMRKQLLQDLVPEGPGLAARFFRWVIRFVRPLVVLLVPVLLVLDALRFDLLVKTVDRFAIGLISMIVLTVFLHRLLSGLAHARIDRVFPPDRGAAAERRREAAQQGAQFVIFLLVTYAAVAGFLAVSGSDSEGMRKMLSVPLPLTGESGGRLITWWNLLMAVVILVIFLKGTRAAKLVLGEFLLAPTKLDKGLQYTITTLVGYLLISTGVLLATSQLVDLSTLGYIAAALSVGIGFGLQEIVSNFVSGLILLFERPLKVGDTVEVGGTRGVVKHISIRATTVQTLDNIVLLVPNREFITQSVVNYSHSDPKLRLHIAAGVSYGSDPALVKKVLLETGTAHALVRKWPAAEVQFLGFGDSSIDFDLLVWINNPDDRNRVRSEIRFALFEAFAAHGIQIPFPQRDLHVRSAEGLSVPVPAPAPAPVPAPAPDGDEDEGGGQS